MDSRRRKRTKLLAAVIGTSAAMTMVALTLGVHQQPVAAKNVAVGVMTINATTTEPVKDETAPATSMAVPAIKGPAPLPKEEADAE